MNTNRRLWFFIQRVFHATCSHQPAAIHFVIRPQCILYHAQDQQITMFSIFRNFCAVNKTEAECDPIVEVKENKVLTLKEFCSQLPSHNEYSDALIKALHCSKKELTEIQENNVYWKSFPVGIVLKRIEAFKKLGVERSDLVKHSSVIFVDFENSYQLLKSACEVLGYDGHELFPLLHLPNEQLHMFLSQCQGDSLYLGNHSNRIRYFSSMRVCKKCRRSGSALFLPITCTHGMHCADNEYTAGLESREEISTQIHGYFKCDVEKVRERIDLCRKEGLTYFKPWLLHCTYKKINKIAEYRKKLEPIVNKGLTRSELVAELLMCPIEEVEAMKKYVPRVRSVSFSKAEETVFFLLSEGSSRKEILRHPRVFLSSIRRLQERLNMLRKAGHDPVRHPLKLQPLCYPTAQFRKFLENHAKNMKEN